ncbi:MAG: hypothetical protein ACIAQ0_10245 [Phycisphaerales bacterium JB058]
MMTLTKRVLVISMVGCAGLAMGQDADKPLLSGPEVNDSRPALVEENFGGEMKMGKARLGAMDAIPANDLRQILRDLGSPEADPLIRLSEEQVERIRELMREYEQDRRAYLQENREEFEALRQAAGIGGDRGRPEAAERDMREPEGQERAGRQARPRAERGPVGEEGPERGPRRGPAGAGAEPTPEQEAARRELRAFMQAGPSSGDLQRRIFAELSPEQQQFIDEEVLLRAEERAQERDMAMLERRRRDRAEEAPGARPGRTPGQAQAGNRQRIDWSQVYSEDGSINLEALPERIRQRIENLDDEQRQRVLDALKKRFETGERLRAGDGG